MFAWHIWLCILLHRVFIKHIFGEKQINIDFEKHISIFRTNVNSSYTFFRTNNSVMPSGAKNRKVSKEKKRKNLAVFAKTRDWNFFFSAKLSSSNAKTVVLTRAPENVDENHDMSFEAPFALKTGWPYWHVIFPVFLFVISGFCLLFGWMLFLAESLSSLWKYFFLVRIHFSVYIINSLIAAKSTCIWASYLFDCKPQLIKFFFHDFIRLTIKGGLHFLFFLFIERYRHRRTRQGSGGVCRSLTAWNFSGQVQVAQILNGEKMFNTQCIFDWRWSV